MFPREQRLRSGKDIIAVLRKGSRRSVGVVACSFSRKPAKVSRIAVIVDTKVSKKAVVRNLLKRRTRALLRQLPLPPGDLVVRLWKGAEHSSFQQLEEQVGQCLRTLN